MRYAELNQVTSLDALSSSAIGDWIVVMSETLYVRTNMSTKIDMHNAMARGTEISGSSLISGDVASSSWNVAARDKRGLLSESEWLILGCCVSSENL